MSQARLCLGGMKKVQCAQAEFAAETGPCGRRICSGGRGRSSRFSPPSATSPHSPMRRGRLAALSRGGYGRRLFLARWIRLPWRHVGSRWRVRPDRLRHPRGLRSPAEAQREEMGAMLLKHRQGGFVGHRNLYVHAARHSVHVLTVGSDETASTPKIVSDVARGSFC
jgi:hypothetical protein